MHVNAMRAVAHDAGAMTASLALRVVAGVLLGLWLLGLATAHTFNGWINVLPLVVLLGVAARFVYALLTLD